MLKTRPSNFLGKLCIIIIASPFAGLFVNIQEINTNYANYMYEYKTKLRLNVYI